MAQLDLKYCQVYILDGTSPTPNEIEVVIGEGNLTYNETREMEYKLDRGLLNTVREGDQKPVEVSMDFEWEFLVASSGGDVTIEEALKNEGEAEDWVSSDTEDACAPYSVDIKVIYTPPCDDADIETYLLSHYRWESLNHDFKAGTVSTSGKCNVTRATVTRTPQA